jgi:hypothetical protein
MRFLLIVLLFGLLSLFLSPAACSLGQSNSAAGLRLRLGLEIDLAGELITAPILSGSGSPSSVPHCDGAVFSGMHVGRPLFRVPNSECNVECSVWRAIKLVNAGRQPAHQFVCKNVKQQKDGETWIEVPASQMDHFMATIDWWIKGTDRRANTYDLYPAIELTSTNSHSPVHQPPNGHPPQQSHQYRHDIPNGVRNPSRHSHN